MVMCRGSPPADYGRSCCQYRASLVYFPSQDAISASVIPHGVSMWSCGTKRKLEEEDETKLSYFAQRQSVLNISMIKLRAQPLRKTEQPLRRSVLIFNTLKSIETELKMEGVRWNLPTRPSLLPSIQPLDVTLDPIPVDAPVEPNLAAAERGPSLTTDAQDKPATMDTTPASSFPAQPAVSDGTVGSSSCELSVDISTASGIQDGGSFFPDSRSILDGLFNIQTSPQGVLPTFSSLLDLDSVNLPSAMDSESSASPISASSSSSTTTSSSLGLPTTLSAGPSLYEPVQHSSAKPSPFSSAASQSPTPSSSSSTSSSSSLQPAPGQPNAQVPPSAEQDLFSDFDFSSLDLDFFSFLPSNLKLPPLSPEDLQSLPHPEAFPQNLASSCNPKHTDLLGDDLDSIMQILVGI
ncbi:hypothetical protein LSH36_94g05053 [Paralvinella palmiformis]|uniref:SERTA domain-containing protein n=1 Tax=Paralvinella palmiformis TaxID=53620 RepID=A0AAD9NCZ4_9ANNE|nr:hypothetical protein LSH36_94g05053 [Paralvinella palmiformis]